MASDGSPFTDEELQREVVSFMQRNFPQIPMHGGDALIRDIDAETGSVEIILSGMCSGCGLSPMTINAIQQRLTNDVPGITDVTVEVADGIGSETPRDPPAPDTGFPDDLLK